MGDGETAGAIIGVIVLVILITIVALGVSTMSFVPPGTTGTIKVNSAADWPMIYPSLTPVPTALTMQITNMASGNPIVLNPKGFLNTLSGPYTVSYVLPAASGTAPAGGSTTPASAPAPTVITPATWKPFTIMPQNSVNSP